jgi:hypothetical protein
MLIGWVYNSAEFAGERYLGFPVELLHGRLTASTELMPELRIVDNENGRIALLETAAVGDFRIVVGGARGRV